MKNVFVGISLVFLALAVAPTSVSGQQQPPLHQGLQKYLPLNQILRPTDPYIPFDPGQVAFPAPLLFKPELDGKPIDEAYFRERMAVERFYASVPRGKTIRVLRSTEGKTVWEYPVGMEVVHLITLRTRPETYFEFRTVRKLPNGRWAYGLYTPEILPNGQKALVLNTYTGLKADVVRIPGQRQQQHELRFLRINLASCQNCHARTSPSGPVGPCAFAPHNPSLETDWAKRFQARTGSWPFSTR